MPEKSLADVVILCIFRGEMAGMTCATARQAMPEEVFAWINANRTSLLRWETLSFEFILT